MMGDQEELGFKELKKRRTSALYEVDKIAREFRRNSEAHTLPLDAGDSANSGKPTTTESQSLSSIETASIVTIPTESIMESISIAESVSSTISSAELSKVKEEAGLEIQRIESEYKLEIEKIKED